MPKTSKQGLMLISGIIAALGLSISLQSIIAATWQAPSAEPPDSNLHRVITESIAGAPSQVINNTLEVLEGFSADGNTLFVDDVNNSVGIGTTSNPGTYRLNVDGDINFSGDLRKNGTLLQFLEDGDFSGNGLMVRTGAGVYNVRTLTGTTNQITMNNGDGATGHPTISLPSTVYLGTSGMIGRDADNLLNFATDNQITFRTNSSNQMVINASGNLNIGSPANTTKKLNIGGEVSATGYCNADITECRTIDELIAGGGGSGTVNSGTIGQTAFYRQTGTAVSGTSTLTVNNARNVHVSKDSIVSNWVSGPPLSRRIISPFIVEAEDAEMTLVSKDISTGAGAIKMVAVNGITGTFNSGWYLWRTAANPIFYNTVPNSLQFSYIDSSYAGYYHHTDNTKLSIKPNGYVGIGTADPAYKLHVDGDIRATGCVISGGVGGGTSGTCLSDRNLKSDIKYLENDFWLTDLMPVSFIMNDDPEARKQFGLIAQDLEKVKPELVSRDKDGFLRVTYGLEIQMGMIQAIKALKEENDALKSAICELIPDNDICK